MLAFEADQFTSLQAQREFIGRHQAVVQTIGALGLDGVGPSEGPALLFGGAAFVVQGIDAHVPGGHPFDLEAVVPRAMFTRIYQKPGFSQTEPLHDSGLAGMIRPSADIPLPVELLCDDRDPTHFRPFIGDEPYTGRATRTARETRLGVLVTDASVIASMKAGSELARVKDLAGIIKAHIVATHSGHDIVHDTQWRLAVAKAMQRMATRDLEVHVPLGRRLTWRGPQYPSWLQQLVKARFAHPAFADMP